MVHPKRERETDGDLEIAFLFLFEGSINERESKREERILGMHFRSSLTTEVTERVQRERKKALRLFRMVLLYEIFVCLRM